MKPIRIVQKPENGRLVIEVPEEIRDETLVVTVEPLPEERPDERRLTAEQVAERIRIFEQFRGRLKNSNYPYDRYDVYNQ